MSICLTYLDSPAAYSPDLNKYFERMNTSSKNLEQHEILKVKLLSNLENSIDTYMELWNKLADMDTLLIRRREGNDPLSERKSKALRVDIATIISQKLINGSLDAGRRRRDHDRCYRKLLRSTQRRAPIKSRCARDPVIPLSAPLSAPSDAASLWKECCNN